MSTLETYESERAAAVSQLADIKRKIEALDLLISLERQKTGFPATPTSSASPPPAKTDERRSEVQMTGKNSKKEAGRRRGEIVAAVVAILEDAGRSMPGDMLVQALSGRGVKIDSDDPTGYLASLLWRNKDRIGARRGEGYFLVKPRA